MLIGRQAILLVGGFGQSNYLKDRLQAELKECQGPPGSMIEILQPTNGRVSLLSPLPDSI